MRNLLALGALGLLGFGGIGWYLGWYKIETSPTPTGRHISIDLNTPKIQNDVSRGREKLRDFLSDENEGGAQPSTPAPQTQQPWSPVVPANYSRPADDWFPAPPSGSPSKLPIPR